MSGRLWADVQRQPRLLCSSAIVEALSQCDCATERSVFSAMGQLGRVCTIGVGGRLLGFHGYIYGAGVKTAQEVGVCHYREPRGCYSAR